MKPLSQNEVNNLQSGDTVIVSWGGDHTLGQTYRIGKFWGLSRAIVVGNNPCSVGLLRSVSESDSVMIRVVGIPRRVDRDNKDNEIFVCGNKV